MENKGILINGIIRVLNEQIKETNKKLCEQKLYSEQKPLHGSDMFLQLAFLSDEDLNKIVKACKL